MELWTKDLGNAQEQFWALLNCQLTDISAPYSAVAQALLFWGDALSLSEQPLCSRLCQLCPCFACGLAGRWRWHDSALTGTMPTPRPSLPFPRTLNPAWGRGEHQPSAGSRAGIFPWGTHYAKSGIKVLLASLGVWHLCSCSVLHHTLKDGAELPLPPSHPLPVGWVTGGVGGGSDLDSYLYFGPKLCIYTIFYVPFFVVTKMNILIR